MFGPPPSDPQEYTSRLRMQDELDEWIKRAFDLQAKNSQLEGEIKKLQGMTIDEIEARRSHLADSDKEAEGLRKLLNRIEAQIPLALKKYEIELAKAKSAEDRKNALELVSREFIADAYQLAEKRGFWRSTISSFTIGFVTGVLSALFWDLVKTNVLAMVDHLWRLI